MATDYSEFVLNTDLLTFDEMRELFTPTRFDDPGPAQVAFLRWLAAEDAAMQSQYTTYRDYYDGEHKYQLTTRMKQFLELDANIKFDLNYLPIPIDVLNERLTVVGFEADAGQGGEDGRLWQWWTANRMDAIQSDVHHAMLRDGDTYALVGWDNERGIPVISHEAAYDGTYGIHVRYHEEMAQRIKFAVKRWRVESGPGAGTVKRMNVYTDSAVFKFMVGRGGWEPLVEQDESGNDLPWPIPWIDRDGRPLGVPVVHFKNNAGGYDFGRSELKDLIPVQDALNKAVIDEIAIADTMAFNWPTLSGGGKPTDDMAIGPGRILFAPQGQWGHIPATDTGRVSDLVNNYITRMAQMSRTPLVYFQSSRQIVGAETQKAGDTGLVSKVEARSVPIGNSWEDVMAIGRRLHNAFVPGDQLADVPISAVWGPFDRIDEEEADRKLAETAQLKAETFIMLVDRGVPRLTAAIRAGYSAEDAQEMATTGGRVLAVDMLAPPDVGEEDMTV